MLIVLSASAIYLAGLQAGINAPRDAFTQCLKLTSLKAESSKVAADAIENYVRTNCGGQINAFKAALIAFDVKNGVPRKEAASGAEDMISGWLGDSIENYKFRVADQSPKPQQAAAPAPAQPAGQQPAK